MTRSRRRERGAVLAMVGMFMIVFFSFAVVAVDIGRLAFTATEVQTVADIAATAGATAAVKGGNAVSEAQSVVGLNTVDGSTASIAAGDVVLGNYNGMAFTAGGAPTNAVRANAMATVDNILAAMVGTPSTTVAKTATATFVTVGEATPELPIAIGSCYFQNLCAGCLPSLIQAPSNSMAGANNTAWTTFFDSNSANTVRGFIQAPCGDGNPIPPLEVGDHVNVTNGQVTNAVEKIQCLLDHNIREFIVPIIQSPGSTCGGPITGSPAVVGFATMVVDSVNSMGSPKYVNLRTIYNAAAPGAPGGCATCGTGHVVLVD